MTLRPTIRKLLTAAACLAALAGMVVLLIAANTAENAVRCTAIAIAIRSESEHYFLDKEDIQQALRDGPGAVNVGSSLRSLRAERIEARLERESWIRRAEVHADRAGVVHITVWERTPVARVFSRNGASFYLDSGGRRLPLFDKYSLRLPLITGYPAGSKHRGADSAAVADVNTVVAYLHRNPFWRSQIAQVDVVGGGKLELLPLIGSHLIRFGRADRLEEKFAALKTFYTTVGTRVGFDRYKELDLQFRGQVIARVATGGTAFDSVAVHQTIASLIAESRQRAFQDSLATVAQFRAEIKRDSALRKLMRELEADAAREAAITGQLLDTVRRIQARPVTPAASVPVSKPAQRPVSNPAAPKPPLVAKPNAAKPKNTPKAKPKTTTPTVIKKPKATLPPKPRTVTPNKPSTSPRNN